MANEPFFYYRTDTTEASDPGFADPADLPANQKLVFEGVGQEVADSFKFLGKNRIAGGTIPQPDGASVVEAEHIGRESARIEVKGYIRDSAEELKLLAFFNAPQQEGKHVKGRFGLKVPLHAAYDIDPTPTVGLIFEDVETETLTKKESIASFRTVLLINGTLVKALP